MLPSDIFMAFALEKNNPVDNENNIIDDDDYKELAAAAVIPLWKVSLHVHLMFYISSNVIKLVDEFPFQEIIYQKNGIPRPTLICARSPQERVQCVGGRSGQQ